MRLAEALSAWGDGQIEGPLDGGHRNQVFAIRLNGQRLVAKSTAHGEAALRWLAPVQCRAVRAGFRAAGLIPTTRGALSHGGWTLEPFLKGRPGTDLRSLAPLLRRFHAACRAAPARPGVPDRRRPPTGVPGVVRHRLWQATGDESAVHGDLCPANVLWSDGQPPALIDWDEARRDLCAFDLNAVRGQMTPLDRAWEVAICWTAEPARARRLLRRL